MTTDRQLNAFADTYDVPSIDSLDFYELMKETGTVKKGYQKTPGQAHKLHPERVSSELDALMQEGSNMLLYKEELPEEDISSHGTSKKEKRLLAVLKKL